MGRISTVVGLAMLALSARGEDFPTVDGHVFSADAQKLMAMNQAQLDALYTASPAGEIPDGRGYGMIMLEPNVPEADMALWKLGKAIWQGKVFDKKAMTGINVVFGLHVVKGGLSVGKSKVDGNESIILDFGVFNTLPPMDKTFDELRKVREGGYLGRMYMEGVFVLNFYLEFAAEEAPVAAIEAPAPFPTEDGHTFSPQAQTLMNMTQAQLDDLYKASPVGAVPNGHGYGMVMMAPDNAALNMHLWQMGMKFWQGKVFDNKAMTGLNIIMHQLAVKGKISVGKSAVDGADAMILDFGAFNKLPPTNKIHDELRSIADGKLLGRMYYDNKFVLNFLLEF